MSSEDYIQHPLNLSPTKQAFSFSKNHRFMPIKNKNNDRMYTLPTTLNRRSCSFGYGNKTAMQNNQSMSPGLYEADSDFDLKKNKHNTISMSIGRQKVKFGSFLISSEKKRRFPGPGTYEIKSPYSRRGGKMAAKLPSQIDFKVKQKNPGPGSYELKALQIKHSGSYIVSNYQNHISPKYHSPSSPNKSRVKTQFNLGPGQYELTSSNFGQSILSKFKNSTSGSFCKQKRKGLADESKKNIPGFKYKRFSEFGFKDK